MKLITSILICLLISFQLQAQTKHSAGLFSDQVKIAAVASDSSTIVINHEMIGRFNAVESEGDIYSWSQLVTRFSADESLELARAYKLSDRSGKSLMAIGMELEEKLDSDPGKQDAELSEYIAYLNQVKEAVNNRLREPQTVAMK